MKKIVGKVTEEEKLEILAINNHKKSLEELLPILPKEDDLCAEASRDMQETLVKYREWWRRTYTKYQWEKGNKDWELVFETNEILLEV